MARPDFKPNDSPEHQIDKRDIDDEVDRLQDSIERLNIKVLRTKRDLERMRISKKRKIETCNSRIAILQNYLTNLSEQQNPPPRTEQPATSEQVNRVKKDEDDDAEEDEEGQLLVHPNRNVQDDQKPVDWQMERHRQWANKNIVWGDLYRILDVRTAAQMNAGDPRGQGNLKLNPIYCRVDPGSYRWGQPAEALLHHARAAYKDPNSWILLDKSRNLLIAMENWFFSLSKEEREQLPESANDWDGMADETIRKWNEALQTGELK
ncbi:hypothetical protein N7478_006993 [Penicillium angulare]|uniref:uncharacterized protein n=1 Tax=Penicillium angulare TaxID=116970 RepID=UPI0025421139|nr:uncharacterized protein N7478_006993 [Penicillium angulare]KAJ5281621.1 hypothetical protein N7478_006993 [Penicillium angulare]